MTDTHSESGSGKMMTGIFVLLAANIMLTTAVLWFLVAEATGVEPIQGHQLMLIALIGYATILIPLGTLYTSWDWVRETVWSRWSTDG